MRIHLLGFGSVAQAMLRMILRNGMMALENIRVVDRSERAEAAFAALGGPRASFRRLEIRRDNLDEVFGGIEPGDVAFALADMLGTRILCERCLAAGIHYLSACSDDFPGGMLSVPSFTADEYRAYRQVFDAVRRPAPSSVISAGMNPGAVSAFVKRAIRELAECKVTDYAVAAQELGVENIVFSDVDDSDIRIPRERGVVYSTWSPTEYYTEMTLNLKLTRGCGVPLCDHFGEVEYEEPETGFVSYKTLSCERLVKSVALDRNGSLSPFEGNVIDHDEIVTVPAYLSVRKDGKTIYRPNTRFVYRAAPIARASLLDVVASGREPTGYHLVGADEISSGGESVGVVVSGARCGSVYVGTRHDIGSVPDGETPTILQVAAGCYAALCQVVRHPDRGPRFPEELDEDEFISTSGLPLTVLRMK